MQRGVAIHDVRNSGVIALRTHQTWWLARPRPTPTSRSAHTSFSIIVRVHGVRRCTLPVIRTWIAALRHGAAESDLDTLLSAVQPIIDQLMGRHALYEWTLLQLRQACL